MSNLAYRPRPSPPRGEVAGGNFVAIGIDFGTTYVTPCNTEFAVTDKFRRYCGVSWAISTRPDEINEITEWPAQYSESSKEDQVPTRLDLRSGKWGHEIEPKMKPIKWFKLLLLKDEDIKREEIRNSEPLKDARKQLADYGMSATQAVATYLEKLWKHTLSQLAQRLDVENLPLRVAITVPAIWPPHAEQAMREAAKIAKITIDRDIGATTLDLVQEPEAAGLSIFLDRRGMPEIQAKESFVVCDAGGGTIDVISYTVDSMSPFHIKECVKGDGKLAGAFRVDEGFAAHMKWETKLKLDSLDTAEHNVFVTRDWEMGAKRTFAGLPEPPQFFLTPPPKAFKTFARLKGKGNFSISRYAASPALCSEQVMAGFFAQSLTGIRTLVRDQIAGVQSEMGKPPRRILLVGGLGSSKYIYSELDKEYPNMVLRPTRPWSAVARGAVIRILQDNMASQPNLNAQQQTMMARIPEVVTRKARYSYGILCNKPITNLPDFRGDLDKVTVDPEGVSVTPRMDWYLTKGDELSKKSPALLKYQQFARGAATGTCAFTIRYSQADIPPKRLDDTVKTLCQIECAWDRPFEQWKQVGSPSEGWRKFDDLALAMRFEGQPKWTMQVGINKTEHDVKVEYMA
ncbi:hypothetical protein QBC35DRAFT_396464 [Podospora australis]|uniref:Uncharacterized protein n=1 Tax=Podospora australis TaxID=1536484 RepID=A0AAN6WHH8_9PEZI|nr:hypothetical protein QBC35DRAFT_396464 [Podospora australis]